MTILGVHTWQSPDDPMDSHAWITVREGGTERSYSLWPTGVEEGRDLGARPDSTLLTKLDQEEAARLRTALEKPQEYGRLSNNCSHFAMNMYEEATGRELSNADNIGGRIIGTPHGLNHSIRTRELDSLIEHRVLAERQESPQPERQLTPAQQEMRDRREAARAESRQSMFSAAKHKNDPGDRSR